MEKVVNSIGDKQMMNLARGQSVPVETAESPWRCAAGTREGARVPTTEWSGWAAQKKQRGQDASLTLTGEK